MAIKYKWLAGRLRELIEVYIERGQTKLPSENELCSRYGVSRQTVRQALTLLIEENLIEKRHGSGTYITGLLSDPEKNRVDILISSKDEYIYPEVLSDLHQSLSSAGFSNTVYETGNRIAKEREILLSIIERSTDSNHPLPRGLIVEACQSALPNPNIDLYNKILQKGIKIVFLFSYYQELKDVKEISYIKDDNMTGSALLVEHLNNKGHKFIGGIFQSDTLQGMERYRGYLNSMKLLNLPIYDENIYFFTKDELRHLEEKQDRGFLKSMVPKLANCSALVCYNDEIAYYLSLELKEAGYMLPEDMSLTAFDNTYLSVQGSVSITTLSHKPHEIGTKAATMMIDKIKGLATNSVEVPFTLTKKESTSGTIS